MEMFQGILMLYYTVEVCYSLRGKDFNNMQHIVNDMEAPWESRPYSECRKMHRTAAERTFNNRRQQWTRPRDAEPREGTGGCLTRDKGRGELAGSEGVWTKVVTVVARISQPFLELPLLQTLRSLQEKFSQIEV